MTTTRNASHGSGTINYHTGREVACGDHFREALCLCPKHEREVAKRFPQGFRYYPGDVCKHGVYTGGCGRDMACWACEMGDAS